jgi:putative DNA primase/helicase
LLEAPDYDLQSGLYGTFQAGAFPKINPRPTRDDALKALATLRELFSECAFEGGPESAHASVALATTLTACVRRSLDLAPVFGFSAPKFAMGKTTTAQAAAQVATGHKPAVFTWPKDEIEVRKSLMSVLLAGDSVVLIDNIDRPVESAALCAAVTSPAYKDRILGTNQTAEASTAVTWVLTGNALQVVGDLTTRALRCVLDAGIENPEAREFQRDLGEYIAEHRGTLVGAVLTIPLAYLAAGAPAGAASRSRFRDWDRLVRRPLLWLGAADPHDTQAELRGIDPERGDLVALLRAWQTVFADEPATVARAISEAAKLKGQAEPDTDLYDALRAVAGERDGSINSRRLGRYIKRHDRRIEDGMWFEDVGEDRVRKTRLYWVCGVSGVSPYERAGNGRRKKGVSGGTDSEKPSNPGCPRCDGEGCEWCQGVHA